MPNQDDWMNTGHAGLTFDLSAMSTNEDTVRAKNKPGQIQREIITDRGVRSPYKIQASLRTCIHGTLDKRSNKPASLIVVDYSVQVAKEGEIFSEATTSFKFSTSNPNILNPSVIAYGPFTEQSRWNYTDVAKSEKTVKEGQVAPEVQGTKGGGFTFGNEKGSEWMQSTFDRGLGTRHYDSDGRAHIVEWTLLANEKQRQGIAPSFRVAMLVEREGDGPFEARFTFMAKGGLGYRIAALSNRFVKRTAVDDPIVFFPGREPLGAKLDGIVIDRYELQALAKEVELSGLSKVWGLTVRP